MTETLPLNLFEETNRSELPEILYRRFDRDEYARAFLAGKIRFRSLIYYQGLEAEESQRGDAAEGSFHFTPEVGTIIQIQSQDGEYRTIGGVERVGSKLSNPERFFISCLSHELSEEQRTDFGSHLVTIVNPSSFIERLTSGLIKKNHMSWGRVTYYDEMQERSAIEAFSPFMAKPLWMMKRNNLSYQSEFRIAIQVGDLDAHHKRGVANSNKFPDIEAWYKELILLLDVGDISDIATMTSD